MNAPTSRSRSRRRTRRRGRRSTRSARRSIRARSPGGSRSWRWALIVAHAARLLRPAVAHVERPPGGAVRPRRAQVLHLRPRVLAAGRHLPHGPADPRRAVAVPVHRGGRAAVVRLRLPADRLHRDLPVDRAQDRGRPPRADAARRGAAVAAQARQQGRQARVWIALALWTGFTFVGYFTPDPRRWLRAIPFGPGRLGDLLDAVLRLRDLRQRRAGCASRCASTCARTRASSR